MLRIAFAESNHSGVKVVCIGLLSISDHVLCKVSYFHAFALLKYLKELIVNNCVLGIFTFCLAIALEGIFIPNIVFWDYLRLDI